MNTSSGVSWLHDKLRSELEERRESLRSSMEKGLNYHEYIQYCGRIRENERQQDSLAALFKDFYQGDDDDE